METSKQNLLSSPETGKITRNVADRILKRLTDSEQVAPSGKPYSYNMVRNWLYEKSKDPKIELAYLAVIAEADFRDKPGNEEKKKMALMHIEMADRILSEL